MKIEDWNQTAKQSLETEHQEVYKVESAGSYGAFGLQINVAVHLPAEDGQSAPVADLDDQSIRIALHQAEKMIQRAIMAVQIAKLPSAQARAKAEREQLLGLFPAPVFVEAIPQRVLQRLLLRPPALVHRHDHGRAHQDRLAQACHQYRLERDRWHQDCRRAFSK